MKQKVKKMADKACDDLKKGLETDDVKTIVSAIQFLERTCSAYIGYLSLVDAQLDDEKVGTDAE